MANENKEKKQRKIECLSASERGKLQTKITGHGKLKATAEAFGINHRTLKNIATTGKGLMENIAIVKEQILSVKSTQTAA